LKTKFTEVINIAKWFAIPPENYLEMMNKWAFHMIIAPHLYASDKYKTFYLSNPHLHTIIDNGLWEGNMVANDELLSWAQILNCDEIIAPDDLSGVKTVELTKEFISYLKKQKCRDDFVIHGAVHGTEFVEKTKCLDKLVTLKVDVIDLPKMLGAKSRDIMLKFIKKKYPDVEIHFLGFYKEEIDKLAEYDYPVRSFDTSVPFKPKYDQKFDLFLPDTFWNTFIISRRIRKYQQLYHQEGYVPDE
jgi:hypothetical protein